MGNAALSIGVDFNEIEKGGSDAQKIWDRIAEQDEYVYQWWSSASSAQELFTSESALAGDYWYGRVGALQQEDVPISYKIPEEGAVHGVSANNMGVEEDPDRYTAELYLNHISKPEPSSIVAKQLPYYQPFTFDGEDYPPNAPESYRENPDLKDFDKLTMWDYPFFNEHASDWRNKFQSTISN
jgi:spermidine/putrescine-binding protein